METQQLILLAENINFTRLQANAIESTASQMGVYGDLVKALKDVLTLLTGSWSRANTAYESLLDGNSVRRALAVVAHEA